MDRSRETVSIRGLETTLERLKALPEAMVSDNGGIVRTSLRQGAVVIRDEMQKNIRWIIRTPNVRGRDESSGLLEASISIRRGKRHATLKGERYWVMIPRTKVYPIGRKVKTQFPVQRVGQILEYGSVRLLNPHPWAGPAFHAKKREAVVVIVRSMNAGIESVERQLKRRIR